MLMNIRKNFRKHLKDQRGMSNLSGLVVIFALLMFLPILGSLVGTYTTWKNLNTITTTTVNMAKKVGGFNNAVLVRYEELLDEYKIDRGRLTTVFLPGTDVKVNKRNKLGIELSYRKKLTFMKIDKSTFSIDITIPVKSHVFSQVYFKPNELNISD
jgi:hypothetical protein